MTESNPALREILAFAQRLDQARISYSVDIVTDRGVSFLVVVPGERWEIEFQVDGTVEVEVFRTDGEIRSGDSLQVLLDRFSDS